MKKELLISFSLAAFVIAAAVWIMDRSMSRNDQSDGSVRATSSTLPPASHPAPSPTSDLPTNESDALNRAAKGSINKCVVNGKTIYSDQKCSQGTETRAMALYDSSGIVSPPRENLRELTARRKAAEAAEDRNATLHAVAMAPRRSAECMELEKYIDQLDVRARQPQTAPTQDWIRQERMKARDRQAAISC